MSIGQVVIKTDVAPSCLAAELLLTHDTSCMGSVASDHRHSSILPHPPHRSSPSWMSHHRSPPHPRPRWTSPLPTTLPASACRSALRRLSLGRTTSWTMWWMMTQACYWGRLHCWVVWACSCHRALWCDHSMLVSTWKTINDARDSIQFNFTEKS